MLDKRGYLRQTSWVNVNKSEVWFRLQFEAIFRNGVWLRTYWKITRQVWLWFVSWYQVTFCT